MLPLHIQNIHVNMESDVYPECGHGTLAGDAALHGIFVSHPIVGRLRRYRNTDYRQYSYQRRKCMKNSSLVLGYPLYITDVNKILLP